MDRLGVLGTEAHREFADGMTRALRLAEVSAQYGDHAQAAEDITAAVDSLEPQLAAMRQLCRPQALSGYRFAQYAAAAAAPLGALALHHSIPCLQHAPILPHTIAVALVSLFLGFRPALVTIAVSVFAAALIIQHGRVDHSTDGPMVLVALHLLTSLLVAYTITRPRFPPRRSPPTAQTHTPAP